ncbi:hypothetical protein ABZT02_36150 [Streptomyces sp. NPDC005402]|uniref:hypothetical protein n=1 Tax=Streptomyces sp. NPDC005402 TaxID=3155338 RepID=UPI0033B9949F
MPGGTVVPDRCGEQEKYLRRQQDEADGHFAEDTSAHEARCREDEQQLCCEEGPASHDEGHARTTGVLPVTAERTRPRLGDPGLFLLIHL